MAPLSRIHATATEVSRPPEKAMPTRSPTGRDWRTLDMPSSLLSGIRTHPSRGPPPSRPDDEQTNADDRDRDADDVARDSEIAACDEMRVEEGVGVPISVPGRRRDDERRADQRVHRPRDRVDDDDPHRSPRHGPAARRE